MTLQKLGEIKIKTNLGRKAYPIGMMVWENCESWLKQSSLERQLLVYIAKLRVFIKQHSSFSLNQFCIIVINKQMSMVFDEIR